MVKTGLYLKFLSKIWSHFTEKIFGNSSRFQRISGSEKFLWMREGDLRFFGWRFFCLTLPKTFFGFSSIFHKTSGSENISWMLGGYHVLPSKNSGLTLAKTLFGNSFGVSENFWYGKRKMEKTEVVAKFRHIFLYQFTERFIENSSLFQKISGRENVIWMHEGISSFAVNFSRLTLPQTILGTLQCFQNFLETKSCYGWEKGMSRFSVELFWIIVPEKFNGKSSWFQKLSGMGRKIWRRRGNATFSQTFFVSFYRESALGSLRCFTKVLVAGILHEWGRGISLFSVANFLYHSFENFLWELFVVSEIFCSENT